MRFRVSLRHLWWLGFLGFVPRFMPGTGPLRLCYLFFLAPLAADLIGWLRRRGDGASDGDAALPAPARRYGESGLLLRYHLSTMVALLNPFQLVQAVRQGIGNAVAARRVAGTEPPPHRESYRLPFDGDWVAANGGITPETSHSWELVGQRYAYDFVVADRAGRHHVGEGVRLEDYLCYGQPILAAADGEVVAVRDGIRDAPRPGTGWIDWRCRDIGGNAVTIRHAAGEFTSYAHLVPGSIRVRVGEYVRSGQVIGKCGNSGHSTEPHLHFQLQDRAEFLSCASLPIRFSGCVVDSVPAGAPTAISVGQRVAHAGGAADVDAHHAAGEAHAAGTA